MWDLKPHPARFPLPERFWHHGRLDGHAAAATSLYWLRWTQGWSIPVLRLVTYICAIFVSLVYLQRLCAIVLRYVAKYRGITPQKLYKHEPLQWEDGNLAHIPTVLVQIPMYNEREVYHLSIGAACKLNWPKDRLIVQVLDDSTDVEVKALVKGECEMWQKRGVNVKYESREGREGYKAGNLRAGLQHSYVRDCDYVAIFDADFQPHPEFLERSLPFLVHNPELGHLMGGVRPVNPDECLVTKLQGITFAGKLSEEIGSAFFGFAVFFGTGGIWRMKAIHDSGGWQSRVLVEDTDLSLCSCLKGWKSVYVPDFPSLGEVAATYQTYRIQTTRWTGGLVNLFQLHFTDVLRSKALSLGTKYYILCDLFGFLLYEGVAALLLWGVLIPTALLVRDINIPGAVLIGPPLFLVTAAFLAKPRSSYHVFEWLFFENVRGIFKARVVLFTLLGLDPSTTWIVTKRSTKSSDSKQKENAGKDDRGLFYFELLMGLFLFISASCASPSNFPSPLFWPLRIFLYLQSLAFFLCGMDVRV